MCVVEQSLVCLEDASDVEEITSTDNHDEDDMSTQRNSCRRAYHCRSLLTDDRVLANLLATERNNRPSADCFCRQTEVLPYMRDTVVTWMLEVRSLKFHFFPFDCIAPPAGCQTFRRQTVTNQMGVRRLGDIG